MNFKNYMNIWFHGSRRKWNEIGGDKQSFGGIHLGTYKAAMDRLEQTPSQRIGGKPCPAFIYEVKVDLDHPYNSPDNPLSEHDLFMLMLHMNRDEFNKIKNNYDGLYYKNAVEDPGSISLIIFDKSKLHLVKTNHVSAI